MKRVLGRMVAIWLSASLWLAAADFDYKLTLQKSQAYVHEPVLLTLQAWQTDGEGEILFFDFSLPKSEDYRAVLLQKRATRTREGEGVRFDYLIFAERAAELALEGRLVVKRTTESRLRHNNTGEPVKAKAIDTTDTVYNLSPVRLNVRPLPIDTAFVGDFRLDVSLNASTAHPHEPIYLTVRVRGTGYVKKGWRPDLHVEGAKLFADKPKIVRRYTKEGVRYDALFSYALLSERSFVVPPLRIEAFSFIRQKPYQLQSRPMEVKVVALPERQLVDRHDEPASIYTRIERLKRWALYGVIFLSGYLSALLVGRLRRLWRPKRERDGLKKAIKEAHDAKALLHLLARSDPIKFAAPIKRLEDAIYRDADVSLKAVKKEALSLL